MGKTFIVAGGGIGGLAAALALHRAGIGVTVYEQAPAFSEIGAGVSLWPNATRVLHSLGVLESLIARGEPVTRFNLLRPGGQPIASISMAGFPTPALCIHRAELHRILREQLPEACLVPGQRVESFAQDKAGVSVKFLSGLEARADGLIAADGINSAVRAQLHGSSDARFRGYTIWRGIAPVTRAAPKGHISETWGAGCRFGIMPMGMGRVCWYATRNSEPARPDAPGGRRAEVGALFKRWHDPIPSLIEATDPSDIIKHDARDRRPIRKWGEGRVTLLGDAAHPITPNVGQGACLAIEDGACVAKALMGEADVGPAFRAYEATRAPRTARIARQARWIGEIGQWESPLVVRARDLVTRLVLSRSPDMRLNAIYAYEA
jgi:2-polyprenyl-6-methoxyphenol hydroxylase-like FAD-dependent oxidoreductase